LGKSENKFSKIGVVGVSAKLQELSGIHFFTTNLPRRQTSAISAQGTCSLVSKVLSTPPTFASSSEPSNRFFPPPHYQQDSGADWSSTKTPQATSSLVPKVLPAPLPSSEPSKRFFPLPDYQQASLEQTGGAALHAGKNRAQSGQSLPGGIRDS